MDDASLIIQIRNGNTNALRFLVDKHKNLVWHMVLRMVNQAEDAEDLCQDVFLRVFRDIKKFRGEAKLSTWIGSIAYNVCIDHIRRKGREKVFPTDDLAPVMKGLKASENTAGKMNQSDLKVIVHAVIAEMPVQYRTVITLFHLEEFSYREIAEITGMPEGTVKSYISRAREMIRERVLALVPDIHPVLYEAD
jgi:RNA polymerase sigma-70 factor (ECF subfamily)